MLLKVPHQYGSNGATFGILNCLVFDRNSPRALPVIYPTIDSAIFSQSEASAGPGIAIETTTAKGAFIALISSQLTSSHLNRVRREATRFAVVATNQKRQRARDPLRFARSQRQRRTGSRHHSALGCGETRCDEMLYERSPSPRLGRYEDVLRRTRPMTTTREATGTTMGDRQQRHLSTAASNTDDSAAAEDTVVVAPAAATDDDRTTSRREDDVVVDRSAKSKSTTFVTLPAGTVSECCLPLTAVITTRLFKVI